MSDEMAGYEKCALCGVAVEDDEAAEINERMERDDLVCVACGRTFGEAREQEGLT